jgi:hypothetical protein
VEGDVYVTVTKLETGETINEVLDMNCGTFVVDIADIVSSGNYVINFMCPDSDAYTGTFSL